MLFFKRSRMAFFSDKTEACGITYVVKEQGTLLAEKCRVLKSNDTYHFQKPRINKTQWYMIYLYNFNVSIINFTSNTSHFKNETSTFYEAFNATS